MKKGPVIFAALDNMEQRLLVEKAIEPLSDNLEFFNGGRNLVENLKSSETIPRLIIIGWQLCPRMDYQQFQDAVKNLTNLPPILMVSGSVTDDFMAVNNNRNLPIYAMGLKAEELTKKKIKDKIRKIFQKERRRMKKEIKKLTEGRKK
jgi:hypothetical protein